jgi:4-carboxymuconolactone decarboxylase
MDKTLYEKGKALRIEVLGPLPETTPLTEAFQELFLEYCWGSVWSRPGLDRKTRSLISIAILGAMQADILRDHIEGAVRNGCSWDEIREVLLQITVYAGIAAGAHGFRAANGIFQAQARTT